MRLPEAPLRKPVTSKTSELGGAETETLVP